MMDKYDKKKQVKYMERNEQRNVHKCASQHTVGLGLDLVTLM